MSEECIFCRLVGMDMGISIAATNAASAANNVTQNLNTTISQLQSSVQGVEGVVKDITTTNNAESLDLTKLSSSISELEGRSSLFSLPRTRNVICLQGPVCEMGLLFEYSEKLF